MLTNLKETPTAIMRLPREYVAYMAKEVLKRLSAEGLIQCDQPDYVHEVMTQVMIEELSVEDHLNDEVRKILDAYDGQMQEMGVSYEDMFKKVKRQLVRDRNVVL
ncbi:MAG: DUF507 family protein [Acidobacteriota bacterium]|nr:DUF507 family protein [Acidobacteriota bacterium]